ncbi:MAG: ferritin-like domain-containing protein [Acidimicrobiales bacterium]
MKKQRNLDHLSNAELVAMTTQLDDIHNDQAMPAMTKAATEWTEVLRDQRAASESLARRTASRRHFLLGAAGATAGGILLAACGSSKPASTTSTTTGGSSTTTNTGVSTDLAVAAMAASLENLAVYAYGAGIMAATAGSLGTVPPAVPVFATTAMNQHKAHAQAWNSVLTGVGKPAVTINDPALIGPVNTQFKAVKTVPELAMLALFLENVAAQTYQNGVGVLSEASAIGVAATIQPVEMQHAAILYFVLGQYPGIQGNSSNMYASGQPLAFNPVDLARPPSDIGSTR